MYIPHLLANKTKNRRPWHREARGALALGPGGEREPGTGGERDNAWNPRSQTPSGRQEEERTVTADGTVGPCEAEEHSCCLMWVERGEDYSRGGEREESGVEMRAEYRWELGTDHPNRGSVSSIARRSHTHTTTSNTTRLWCSSW